MTIGEFVEKQKKAIEAIKENNFMGLAVAETHAMMDERIFDKELNSEGNPIGNYNTLNAIYVETKNESPKQDLPARGKYGDTHFLSGKPHKRTFYQSYKAFHDFAQKATQFVNLQLFGTLRNDFSNGLRRIDNFHWVAEVKMQESADKIEGNERRFGGNIFSLSEEEEQFFKDSLTAQLVKILS